MTPYQAQLSKLVCQAVNEHGLDGVQAKTGLGRDTIENLMEARTVPLPRTVTKLSAVVAVPPALTEAVQAGWAARLSRNGLQQSQSRRGAASGADLAPPVAALVKRVEERLQTVSLAKLAQECEIFTTTLRQVRNDGHIPRPDALARIVRVLGLSEEQHEALLEEARQRAERQRAERRRHAP